MNYNNLRSKTIRLRLVEKSDSEFIHSLRMNSLFNKHLSYTSGGIAEQEKWIDSYKLREKDENEFYFIIERIDNNKAIGTVRLYDFQKVINSFCWGSWILNNDKTASAALESALLVYKFAFNNLDFAQSHFDVRKENSKVIAFHEKLGAEKVSETDMDFFYVYKRDTFDSSMSKFKKYLVE